MEGKFLNFEFPVLFCEFQNKVKEPRTRWKFLETAFSSFHSRLRVSVFGFRLVLQDRPISGRSSSRLDEDFCNFRVFFMRKGWETRVNAVLIRQREILLASNFIATATGDTINVRKAVGLHDRPTPLSRRGVLSFLSLFLFSLLSRKIQKLHCEKHNCTFECKKSLGDKSQFREREREREREERFRTVKREMFLARSAPLF